MNEYETQKLIFEWAEMQKFKYPELELLNCSLNGIKLSIGQAVKAKHGGMKRGYPDLFLPVARGKYHGLFIELKVGNNKALPNQKWWLEKLSEQGYCAIVAYGFDETINAIKNYLKI